MNPAARQTDQPKATPDRKAPPDSPAELLKRNLAALAEVDPAPAQRLAELNLSDYLTAAVGRDGSHTFKRRHPDGGVSWLGRTSMPTVSGPALLQNFDHRGGNIALHGLGQGYELAALIRRIEPCRTIFVFEPDPVAAVGALALYDLAAAFRTRQIVLLIGDDAADQVLLFLEESPGFEPPERFPQWPWQSPVEIARFKSVLEDLYRVVGGHRRARIGELKAAVREAPPISSARSISSCLLVSRRFGPASAEVADDLMDAGRARGWSMAEVTWHRPGRTSELGLLSEVHRAAPQFLLLLNEVPGRLGDTVPANLPVVCWFLDPKLILPSGEACPGPNTIILAESPETARRLRDAGLVTDHLIVLPPGAGPATDVLGRSDSADPPEAEWDLACFADAPDPAAEGVGAALSGLANIWKALTSALVNQADRAEARNLEQMLDTVTRAGRLRISDQRVRADLLGRLEFGASEPILVRHYLGALVKAGVRVRLWGNGWEEDKRVRRVWAGPRPDSAEKLRVFARSPLVLDCCIRERLSRDTLTAALAGAVPLVRGRFASTSKPSGSPETWPDGCRPRELELPTYLRAEQLVKTVTELLKEPDRRSHLAESIAARVRAGHLASHRLDAVARLLAERMAR